MALSTSLNRLTINLKKYVTRLIQIREAKAIRGRRAAVKATMVEDNKGKK